MSETPPRIVLCPTCGKRVKWSPGNEFRPFCSERCKLIDLGGWAAEQHRIPGVPDEDDLSSDDPNRNPDGDPSRDPNRPR